MKSQVADPRVALVYPPFGPPNLASLGLANIQAGIKEKGFACRTFYWAYRFMRQLPVADDKKRELYYLLTQRNMSPWSEWIFTRHALGDQLAHMDMEADAGLRELDQELRTFTYPTPLSQVIMWLLRNMRGLLVPVLAELEPYDIIGVASTFYQNGAALALCKEVKDRWPEKITVLGGANCDGDMGRALMDNFPFLDYVFVGEVDFEVPQFVQCIRDGDDPAQISGLCYRDPTGAVRQSPKSHPVHDMDKLPIPDFDDWIAERKVYGIHDQERLCLPLESSRGCWWGAKHHCTFCGLNANGMTYRKKSPQRFQSELEIMIAKYGAKYFFMADNILSMDYYDSFIEWAKKRELELELFYEIKSNVSRTHVKKLADAGIQMVQPGIEHFSSEVLGLMRKGVKGIQNVAFLKYAAEQGIITIYSILAGLPGEDPNEYGRLAKEIRKLVHLKPPSAVITIEFHRFSPYHYSQAEFGIELRPHDKYKIIYGLPERELNRLAYQFDLKGRRLRDLTYLIGITRVVNEWRDSYSSRVCTLTWGWERGDIIVKDRRQGFPERNYRFAGHAVNVFRAFESPLDIRNVASRAAAIAEAEACSTSHNGEGRNKTNRVEESEITFSREVFEGDPLTCIKPMMDAGLLWEEDQSYLNLAIAESHKPTTEKWLGVQVP